MKKFLISLIICVAFSTSYAQDEFASAQSFSLTSNTTSEVQKTHLGVPVSSNPKTKKGKSNVLSYEILSQEGIPVISKKVMGLSKEMDFSSLTEGVYFINLYQNGILVETQKCILK